MMDPGPYRPIGNGKIQRGTLTPISERNGEAYQSWVSRVSGTTTVVRASDQMRGQTHPVEQKKKS